MINSGPELRVEATSCIRRHPLGPVVLITGLSDVIDALSAWFTEAGLREHYRLPVEGTLLQFTERLPDMATAPALSGARSKGSRTYSTMAVRLPAIRNSSGPSPDHSTPTSQAIPAKRYNGRGDWRLRQATEFISRRFRDDKLSASHVAVEVGVTAAHLSRALRRTTGNTFKSFLTEMRTKEAARLLRNSALSIKEIAAMSGFGNTHRLDRSFRRLYGVPPSAFR